MDFGELPKVMLAFPSGIVSVVSRSPSPISHPNWSSHWQRSTTLNLVRADQTALSVKFGKQKKTKNGELTHVLDIDICFCQTFRIDILRLSVGHRFGTCVVPQTAGVFNRSGRPSPIGVPLQ